VVAGLPHALLIPHSLGIEKIQNGLAETVCIMLNLDESQVRDV
jgi:hypothetical protein